jgi:hypothetical protein
MEAQILQYLQSGGVLALLVFIVYGGSKGWWVYGRTHDDMRRERDEWKAVATGAITSVKDTLAAMEPLVEQIARRP